MTKDEEVFTLPASPVGLCFDKNQFSGSTFSVDSFLHAHRGVGSLGALRDDLGAYLRVLRAAMIQLINKDYADFVSLSANLTCLEKQISDIQAPLGQLREEVLQVKECLSEAMRELRCRLEQRRVLRQRKRALQQLASTRAAQLKLTAMLGPSSSSAAISCPLLMERAAAEYNQLLFSSSRCLGLLGQRQLMLVDSTGTRLDAALKDMFLRSVRQRDKPLMQRCLHTFAVRDQISMAEEVVCKEVLQPALSPIICEAGLRGSGGLRAVLTQAKNTMEDTLQQLITITNRDSGFSRFNFLVHSFWSCVASLLELQMSSVFAPGDPEVFLLRYTAARDFLQELAALPQGRLLYTHPAYHSFLQRWNLPVYFQIRFQEIAGSMEKVLSDPELSVKRAEAPAAGSLRMHASSVCWSSLQRCWSPQVYILALTHRFWKLTLQILARYCTFLAHFTKNFSASPPETSSIGKDQATSLILLILLHADIEDMLSRLPDVLDMVLHQLGPRKLPDTHRALSASLGEAARSLQACQEPLRLAAVQFLSEKSGFTLKQLHDVPRLFRKTNREVCQTAGSYVTALLKPLQEFQQTCRQHHKQEKTDIWMTQVYNSVTKQYVSAVSEVLMSVQKTEESLRRLKQIRERGGAVGAAGLAAGAPGVSDDDKIRQQLLVDARAYSAAIREALPHQEVQQLQQLEDMLVKAQEAKQ